MNGRNALTEIYVTEFMIARHEELIPIYEHLGKTEYVEKEKRRLDLLRAIIRKQNNKQPIQLSLF